MVVKADFVSLFDAISRGFLQRLKWNLGERDSEREREGFMKAWRRGKRKHGEEFRSFFFRILVAACRSKIWNLMLSSTTCQSIDAYCSIVIKPLYHSYYSIQ
jgi:hypothetical protein